MSLSPATVRNVMSDLEQLGLIYSPHVSAGRLPTQQGLRFFVDAFMEIGDLSDDERQVIEAQVQARGDNRRLDNMLTEASQMLSGMSRGAGLVLAAKTEVRAQAYRIHPARADQGAGRAGLAERRGGEPRRRPSRRRHRLAAARGGELSQRPYPRPHAGRGAQRDRARSRTRPARELDACRRSWSNAGSPSGPGPKAASRPA